MVVCARVVGGMGATGICALGVGDIGTMVFCAMSVRDIGMMGACARGVGAVVVRLLGACTMGVCGHYVDDGRRGRSVEKGVGFGWLDGRVVKIASVV